MADQTTVMECSIASDHAITCYKSGFPNIKTFTNCGNAVIIYDPTVVPTCSDPPDLGINFQYVLLP